MIEGYAVCIYDGKGTILEDQYLDGASETCVQQVSYFMSPPHFSLQLYIDRILSVKSDLINPIAVTS